MFAKWDNGLLLISDTEQSGYKPMTNTNAPIPPAGYRATFYWQETSEDFVQTWEIVADEQDESAADEALTRYANELTNGNAENIQEATENLIKIVKEDK